MTFAVLVSAPSVALITALPAFSPVAEPFELMTTEASDELHVTRLFTFCFVPSLNVPVAVKPKVVEGARSAEAGVTAIDDKVAALTVSAVAPICGGAPPAAKVAVMLELPAATPVAVAPVIVAKAVLLEVHVQSLEIVWLVPSVKPPVAVKLSLVPTAIVGFTGVTVTELMVAPLTVSDSEPVLPFSVAVMLLEPGVKALALPPVAVATDGVSEAHVASEVMFNVLPLSKVPVAVSARLVPCASVKGLGVMAIAVTLSALTVKLVLSVFPLRAAPMVVEPGAMPVANPPVVIVATAGAVEDQVAEFVTSKVPGGAA